MTKGRVVISVESGLWMKGTADPSASLGMTKGTATLPFRFDDVDDEQQAPPLRCAPVGMTLLFEYWEFGPAEAVLSHGICFVRHVG